jgi:predicted AAA+ superfamily ATPase
MGRYLGFHLHPLSYGELESSPQISPEQWRKQIMSSGPLSLNQKTLESLSRFGGFPEPFFAQSDQIARVWRKGHQEKLVREDLRDLSRLPELSQVEMLTSLLPDKVGSQLSVQSLREDLEVAHDTVNRWLSYLQELFYFFRIQPWSKSIPRSLKKEPKIYLYDWAEVENEGPRFENLIASHLLKSCNYWNDTGQGKFDLFYVRNKEKQEIDFLMTNNNKPWLAVEAKFSETQIETARFEKLLQYLKCPFIQVVYQPNIWRPYGKDKILCSANRFLTGLP